MAPRKGMSPKGESRKEQWLPSEGPNRARPWAYEDVLLGSPDDRERLRELAAVVEELDSARADRARLYRELDEQFLRISRLETRQRELTPVTERDESHPCSSRAFPRTRVRPGDDDAPRARSAERSYSLTRCEGFEVESPDGLVGFVDGLRFVSRIDQPDLLEVRGGRLGRKLLLIPTDQVEEIRPAEERVLVRGVPTPTGDLLAELFGRFRRALHVDDQAAS
jgi:hypothetical protein